MCFTVEKIVFSQRPSADETHLKSKQARFQLCATLQKVDILLIRDSR